MARGITRRVREREREEVGEEKMQALERGLATTADKAASFITLVSQFCFIKGFWSRKRRHVRHPLGRNKTLSPPCCGSRTHLSLAEGFDPPSILFL